MRRQIPPTAGLSQSAWLRLDAISAAALIALYGRELLEKRGRNVNFGLSKKTWDSVETASIAFAIAFAFRQVVDVMEEYEILFGKDTFFTGKGLVATAATRYNEF